MKGLTKGAFYWRCESYLSTKFSFIVNAKKYEIWFHFWQAGALFIVSVVSSGVFSTVLFAAVEANLLVSQIYVCNYKNQSRNLLNFKQSTSVFLTSTRGTHVSMKSQKNNVKISWIRQGEKKLNL